MEAKREPGRPDHMRGVTRTAMAAGVAAGVAVVFGLLGCHSAPRNAALSAPPAPEDVATAALAGWASPGGRASGGGAQSAHVQTRPSAPNRPNACCGMPQTNGHRHPATSRPDAAGSQEATTPAAEPNDDATIERVAGEFFAAIRTGDDAKLAYRFDTQRFSVFVGGNPLARKMGADAYIQKYYTAKALQPTYTGTTFVPDPAAANGLPFHDYGVYAVALQVATKDGMSRPVQLEIQRSPRDGHWQITGIDDPAYVPGKSVLMHQHIYNGWYYQIPEPLWKQVCNGASKPPDTWDPGEQYKWRRADPDNGNRSDRNKGAGNNGSSGNNSEDGPGNGDPGGGPANDSGD